MYGVENSHSKSSVAVSRWRKSLGRISKILNNPGITTRYRKIRRATHNSFQQLCLLFHGVCEFLNLVVHIALFAKEFLDLRGRVQNGRVVAPTERLPDLWQ